MGITPAYAGKRIEIVDEELPFKDHPRLRGEKRITSAVYLPNSGSPPLTRGKD